MRGEINRLCELGVRSWDEGVESYPDARMTPANRLLPGVLAEILRKAPLTHDKVTFAWRTAVGPAVDKATSVDLLNGVLYVVARDAVWQREVERSAPLIRARLGDLLGDDVVRVIKVTGP